MLKMQTHNRYFRLNTTTNEKYIMRKMSLKFRTLYFTFFSKQYLIYFLLQNINPLELRDNGGDSETDKNGWMRLCASIF